MCEKISVTMCLNVSYNCTKMPNILLHRTQAEAALELNQFQPLVKVGCSSALRLFLCSIYVPKFEVHRTVTKPCRSLCEKARQGCEPMMVKFGFSWPDSFNCSRFDQRDCLEEGGKVNKNPLGKKNIIIQ